MVKNDTTFFNVTNSYSFIFLACNSTKLSMRNLLINPYLKVEPVEGLSDGHLSSKIKEKIVNFVANTNASWDAKMLE